MKTSRFNGKGGIEDGKGCHWDHETLHFSVRFLHFPLLMSFYSYQKGSRIESTWSEVTVCPSLLYLRRILQEEEEEEGKEIEFYEYVIRISEQLLDLNLLPPDPICL